jgi:hypothetical protein
MRYPPSWALPNRFSVQFFEGHWLELRHDGRSQLPAPHVPNPDPESDHDGKDGQKAQGA